jgi:RNA polymerase sigma-70 factor (ECF subfamily)
MPNGPVGPVIGRSTRTLSGEAVCGGHGRRGAKIGHPSLETGALALLFEAMQRANPVGVAGPGDALTARDARAFERLYDEFSTPVYRTALRVVGNRSQAQDIMQDVFMRLWRQPERFDAARGTLGNYLRLMAYSRALDVRREAQVAWRARERMKVLALRDEGRPDDRPPVAAELRRDRAIVRGALTRLPAPQRQAIVLAYWGGLTADEIADRSGLPVGTVKSRIRLGLGKLRDRCEPQLGRELPLAA